MSATVYTQLPANGAASWREPVSTATALPVTASVGDVRITQDTGYLYAWSGSAWTLAGGGGGGGISALTGDVTASGTGSVAATIASVGGSSAANVNAAEQTVNTAQSGNKILASPSNGSSGAPAFRAIVAADVPTLNQNTTGTSSNVTGTVTETHGGTNQTAYTTGDTLYASATNTISKLAVGTTNQIIGVTSSGVPGYVGYPADYQSAVVSILVDDFAANNGDTTWLSSSNGTGAGITSLLGTVSHPGIVAIATGTTNTGRGVINKGLGGTLVYGGGTLTSVFIFQIPTLSNSTDEYFAQVGWASSATAAPSNGVTVEYNRSNVFQTTTGNTHTNTTLDNLASTTWAIAGSPITGTNIPANTTIASVDSATQITMSQAATGSTNGGTVNYLNGDYLSIKCVKSSSITATLLNGANGTTAVPVVANSWYKAQMVVNAAGSSVTFTVTKDTGAPYTPSAIASNVPTTFQFPIIGIYKSAGTTSVAVNADFYKHVYQLTTAR